MRFTGGRGQNWMTMLVFIVGMMATHAMAAVNQIPLQQDLVIAPGERQTITVEAETEIELGWEVVSEPACETDCIEVVDQTDGRGFTFTARANGLMTITPVDGRVAVDLTNKAEHPVTLIVYRLERICEAESCGLIDDAKDGRWMVFKIDEFTSIETSADESFSTISGITTTAKPFIIKAVWWRYDPEEAFACAKFIRQYINEGVPKEEYHPYVLAGTVVEDENGVVLTSVDTCAPKAPNFGAPAGSIY